MLEKELYNGAIEDFYRDELVVESDPNNPIGKLRLPVANNNMTAIGNILVVRSVEHGLVFDSTVADTKTIALISRDENREQVRISRGKRLGVIGLSGTVAVSSIYTATEMLGIPASSTTLGGLATGMATGIMATATAKFSNRMFKRRAIKNTTNALADAQQRVLQPENNAVSFYLDPAVSRPSIIFPKDDYDSRQKFSIRTSTNLPPQIRQLVPKQEWGSAKKETWIRNHHLGLSFGGRFDTPDEITFFISPGTLIIDLLQKDTDPNELWATELFNKAQKMSDAQKEIVALQQKLKNLENRVTFTGIEQPTILDSLQKQLLDIQSTLLSITLETIDLGKQRKEIREEAERIKNAQALINEITSGEVKVVHPLEMHIQIFHDEASIALASLFREQANDKQSDTFEIAKALAAYLKGMREPELLTDGDQIQQFYEGMYDKFIKLLPSLNSWESVRTKFLKLDNPIA